MPPIETMVDWAAVPGSIMASCTCACNCVCACPQGSFSSTSNWKNTNNTDAHDFSTEQLGIVT